MIFMQAAGQAVTSDTCQLLCHVDCHAIDYQSTDSCKMVAFVFLCVIAYLHPQYGLLLCTKHTLELIKLLFTVNNRNLFSAK